MNNRRSEDLFESRVKAAIHSGGHSDITTYELVEGLIQTYDLKGDVLDFGSGIGIFTQRLKTLERFRSIIAADIIKQEKLNLEGIGSIVSDLNEPLMLSCASVDVIFALEIIEHLENFRAVFREWNRLLRPGGFLIFSTPNNESWRSIFSLVFKGHFVAFRDGCYPAHISAILEKDIERVCQETAFKQPEFIYTNLGVIPLNTKYKWQTLSLGLLKGRRFSDGLVVVTKKL